MSQNEISSDIMQLTNYGINVQAGLDRFMGKEAIYKKCLAKFIDDKSLEKLVQAMEKGEHKEADDAAHTLAGVAGNLSMDSLHASLVKLRGQLKENKIDNDQLKEVANMHEAIVNKIKEILL